MFIRESGDSKKIKRWLSQKYIGETPYGKETRYVDEVQVELDNGDIVTAWQITKHPTPYIHDDICFYHEHHGETVFTKPCIIEKRNSV